MRLILITLPFVLSACSMQELKSYTPKKKQKPKVMLVQPTNVAKSLNIAEADYEDQREKNYRILRGNNNEGQYVKLDRVLSKFLMEMFASVPKAIQATKGFIGKTLPIQMMPAMKATAQTNTFFGFLLAIALLVNYWI